MEFRAAQRRRRLASAEYELERSSRAVTDEAIAELLGVSARTVGRWREMSGK